MGNIFLVGMMGAGKTTVGRALALRMGLDFVDTDRLLVERTGVPVSTIFEIEGEAGFRKREAALLAELAQHADCVIATGGGSVLAEANRTVMRSHGIVVYLLARLENLWQRMRNDTSRPLLATPDPKGTLERLLREREPMYEAAAHITIDTSVQSAGTLANRVASALRAYASNPSP